MKYLLDTHVWLWSLLESTRMRRETVDLLRSSQRHSYLSPVSVWETLLLFERGRLEPIVEFSQFLDEALDSSKLLEAPLTFEIARESRRLRLEHQDPADRFIVATAKVKGLTLITADAHLLASTEIETLRA